MTHLQAVHISMNFFCSVASDKIRNTVIVFELETLEFRNKEPKF